MSFALPRRKKGFCSGNMSFQSANPVLIKKLEALYIMYSNSYAEHTDEVNSNV